mgnify:FL=1
MSLTLVRNYRGNYGYVYSYTFAEDYDSQIVAAKQLKKFTYGKNNPTYSNQGKITIKYTYNGKSYTKILN